MSDEPDARCIAVPVALYVCVECDEEVPGWPEPCSSCGDTTVEAYPSWRVTDELVKDVVAKARQAGRTEGLAEIKHKVAWKAGHSVGRTEAFEESIAIVETERALRHLTWPLPTRSGVHACDAILSALRTKAAT